MRSDSPETLMPSRWTGLDRAAAVAVSLALGLRLTVVGPVNLGLALAVALAPVWLAAVIPLRAKGIAFLGVCSILNGLALNAVMAPTHEISSSVTIAQTLLISQVVVGAGAMVWAKMVLGAPQMAVWYGLGIVCSEALKGFSPENPWKFDLVIPVSICVLGIFWWRRWLGVELAALAGLAVISALNDSRSAASILAMTFLIVLWQRIRAHLRLRSTPLRVLGTVAFVGLISYFAMQSFILEGLLGEGSKARTEAQLQAAGSVILGGRPELGGTIALLEAQPMGYGMGVVLDIRDIYIAKSGMAALNYNPNNGYVETYMFGGGIEVHSVLGDLWLRFGLAGLAFAIVMLGTIVVGVARQLASGCGQALTTFIAIQVVWDAFFSPFYTTAAQVLMLGVALMVGGGAAPDAERPEVSDRTTWPHSRGQCPAVLPRDLEGRS